MRQSLTYQTSFIKDSYSIFSDEKQVGKLFKKEWLGSTIETSMNGHKFIFVSKGFFNPIVLVIDKATQKTIGTIAIKDLRIYPFAILILVNNQQFRWTSGGVFSHDWKWQDLSNGQTVINSNESLNLFRQNGMISITRKNKQQELLIALGIHLRNVIQRKALLAKVLGLIVGALLIWQLFA
ncbi:MAG TPA: hypothetical protein VFW07_07145 [Parafilimonas sp.]|nr:hypothetical protein [Parafilimonas sp.]